MIVDIPQDQFSRTRARPSWGLAWVLGMVCVAVMAGVGYRWWPMDDGPRLALQPVVSATVSVGRSLSVQLVPRWDRPIAARLEYAMLDGPSRATIDPRTGFWQWTPDAESAGRKVRVKLEVRNLEQPNQRAVCEFSITVREVVERPASKIETEQVAADEVSSTNAPEPVPEPAPVAGDLAPTELEPRARPFKLAPPAPVNKSAPVSAVDGEALLELEKLYQAGTLCQPATHPTLRRLFAERFAKAHAGELQTAFQGSGAELQRWLGQHAELRDELYTALDETDDVIGAMAIMVRIHAKSPERLVEFFELAIALAVTWDNESGVYDYSVHQRRSHATVAKEKPCDAVDNFQYYSDPDSPVERRVRRLPWEFLLQVVNHRTPLSERKWVLRTYLDQRRPIGQCYDDVTYDHQMIKSGETTSNLENREYTLPNLKDRGGICVMQADYACRVAKCLGTPAAYVEGLARSGGNHAWVMWTGLGPTTTTGLTLSLESHGRFFIDRYHVGQLLEPQSGKFITDRELELRLQAIGQNPRAYRQARLIMRGWIDLRHRLGLTTEQQLDLLESVTTLSPGHQSAWVAIADLARRGDIRPELQPRMDGLRDRCLKNFSNCPDFICQIIDGLLAYQPELTRRQPTYDQLLQQWASTGRPDLTCRLRLQLTELLLIDKQHVAALGGLAQTIKRFPDEGRYIPSLLDKYEAVAKHVEGGAEKVSKLYQDLFPTIPRRRQGQTSPYYLLMLGRAVRHFRQAGDQKAAAAYAEQLKRLQSKP